MIYLGFILISMLHLLDLHYLRKRGLKKKAYFLNFILSMTIIILSFHFYIKYGSDGVDEYIIIVSFLMCIVAYIKLNINKFL